VRAAKTSGSRYAWQEYGVTHEELDRFVKRTEKAITSERERGLIKRFTGDLEKDLVD
jgi:hypothetical protein